jgi:uncharacterized protein YuzE
MTPMYVHIRTGTVAETRELVPGEVMGDFDASGKLLGIEVLDYCHCTVKDAAFRAKANQLREFVERIESPQPTEVKPVWVKGPYD